MVIAKLMGGLGNQMFQYATAKNLAHKLQTSLKLDASFFERDPLRHYSLTPFNIQEDFASPKEIKPFRGILGNRIARRIFRIKQKLHLLSGWTVIEETIGYVNVELFSASGDVYLVGYWQSEKYFSEIEEAVRNVFTFKDNLDAYGHVIATAIKQTRAISLHIRRGDYVSNPKTNQFHGVCGLNYYQACVEQVTETVSDPHFFIFSDDPEWVVENLRLPYPTTFVNQPDSTKDWQDLRLMSLCQHHIIANSSFSWWGAWLNSNPTKMVFAPQKWFNKPEIDTSHMIPDSWIRV